MIQLTLSSLLSSGFAPLPHGGTTSRGMCPAVDVVPGLAGMMPSDKLKINLGYDLWSPYVYILNGEPTGFGIEFVKLMQASSEPECQALDIEMVQDHWGRMWYDGETSCTAPLTLSQLTAHEEAKLALTSVECKSQNIKLGDGVNNGIYHGGMTYTHLKGVRQRMGEFTNAITMASTQSAGLIVKLQDGKPVVSPLSDLSGEKIIDVAGYAPTTDTLELVENHCVEGGVFKGYTWEIPTANGNKAAMELFKSSDAKLMYVYSDQAYDCIGSGFTDDCVGWEGFGTEYAYLHMGMSTATNGTTIAYTKKNSGVADALNPCIQNVMQTQEYYELCKAPLRSPTDMGNNLAVCFPNSFWSADEAAKPAIYNTPHSLRDGSVATCSGGYCQCGEMPA